VSVLRWGHHVPPVAVPLDSAPEGDVYRGVEDDLVEVNLGLAWKFRPAGPNRSEDDALAIRLIKVGLEVLGPAPVGCLLGWVEGDPLPVSPLM
jgi:hypothetical protein